MNDRPERTWTDDQVQDILRRFAATRETLGVVLQVITENLESEAAYALLQDKEAAVCPACKGAGAITGTRCRDCKGIGRVAA